MSDLLIGYLAQLTTITAIAMGLTEFLPWRVGTVATAADGKTADGKRPTRKRWTAMGYSAVLNALGYTMGIVTFAPPPATWYANIAGWILLSLGSVAFAHTLREGKRLISKK